MQKDLFLYHFFCVWGEVNFDGGQKKADLIKGGIKFGRNIVRGKELRIRPGGNMFFDNLNV